MDKKITKYQKDVLKALSGRAGNFYLAGGTALSLFYFQHRLSVDLDFFARVFVHSDVKRIVAYLENALKKKMTIEGQSLKEKTAKIVVYNMHFTAKETLKIDFVEDTVDLLNEPKLVDGIRVLSLEDIYLRKLYALAGMFKVADETGRNKFIGGRTEAKDFYDVYFLSHTFMPLSEFLAKYCDHAVMEAIVRWFRTFDRTCMMDGVLALITSKAIDYKLIERHFKVEINEIIEHEIGEL
ncbi:MAG: nucleotidyl transferase AbiEii/AbiGii toxin family protein [Candidatus Omnitrophica bacterium]|nr:nucleotidyl transferase AbiEii/AbiGii toxin family protein [Candidatus Omnitrophota bacterium]